MEHLHRPVLNESSRRPRARANRRIPFSRSLHSFVRKRLARLLPASEITAELFRAADSPWVRCHLEVHASGIDLEIDELARGPQQALELCAREAQQILISRALVAV